MSAIFASSFKKSFETAKLFAFLFFLQACSQIVILQPGADDIDLLDETPVVTYSHMTPGEFSAVTSEVKLFGSANEATALVKIFSDSTCSTLIQSAAPLAWESVGAELSLTAEATTSIHAKGVSEGGIEGDCTHMADFTHSSLAPVGLSLLSPGSSPGNDTTPSFMFDVEGANVLSASDKITLHATPDCSGPALVIDEATSGLTVLSGIPTGTGTLTLSGTTPLTPGSYLFTARREADSGQQVCSSSHPIVAERFIAYQVDTSAPSDVAPADINIGAGDNLNTTSPTFTGDPGSAEPGSTVDIDIVGDTTGSCSTTVAGDGSWSCTVPGLTGGANQSVTAQIVVTDPAGNSSGSTDVAFTIDTVDPASVTVTTPTGGSNTNDNTPTISGNGAEADATIEVTTGASSCTTTADGGGNWSCDLSPALGEGAHSIDVVQVDDAGNRSVFVDVDITVDTGVPGAPSVSAPANASLINDPTPTISGAAGSAEAGATVDVSITGDATGSCSTTAAGDGSWSCDSTALTGGAAQSLTISVAQTDAASNTSAPTVVSVTLDTVTPGVPVITSPSEGDFTNDEEFAVSGTGLESGTTITVTATGAGGSTCSTSTDLGGGTWSCVFNTTPLSGGAAEAVSLSAVQEDLAGNASSASTAVNVTLDTEDPMAPSVSAPASGATVTTGDVTVSGNSEANALISVTVDGQSADCSTTANGAGAWSCILDETLTDAGYTLRATAMDQAGNGPSPATAVSFTVVVPATPTWSHQAYLKAPNLGNGDRFGNSVSISGDTAIVGAFLEHSNSSAIIHGTDLSASNDAGNNNGAVYVFRRAGSTWSLEAYLKAPNTSNDDNFGRSVDLSGNIAVVGAIGESSTTTSIIRGSDLSSTNISGDKNGAAYVFVRSGSTWSHEAYLKATNSSNDDLFGVSVSISGDTLIVGSPEEASSTTDIIHGTNLTATNESGNQNGAVYVYRRVHGLWNQEAYLKAPNSSTWDRFGSSTSLNGNTALVGAHIESSNTTAIIHGSDLSATNNSGLYNGAVYVFVRNGSTWTHEAYLKAPNSSDNDSFGYSASLSGDVALIGAIGEGSNSTSVINGADFSSSNDSGNQNGAAYIFRRSGSTWSYEAYLKAPNTSDSDNFGSAVSVLGNVALVTAKFEDSSTTATINGSDLSTSNDSGDRNGAVYVFTKNGSSWEHTAYLKSPNGSDRDQFGRNLELNSDHAILGAEFEDSTSTSIIHGSDLSTTNNSGSDNGAAYVFTLSGMPEAPGIALNTPASSPSQSQQPSFTITKDDGEAFVATDQIQLFGGMDCSGTALEIDEAVGPPDQRTLDGVTGTSSVITLATTNPHDSGSRVYYSLAVTDTDGVTRCSSAHSDSDLQFVSYEVDQADPLPPTITSHTDMALLNTVPTTISGTGIEPGATVNLSITGDRTSSCSTSTYEDGGAWSCTIAPILSGGANVSIAIEPKQTDAAGLVSTVGGVINLTIDTVDPAAPVITSPADSATILSGDITVVGTAEANMDVTVTVDGETADCSATADGSGDWSCTLDETLANASYTIRAVQVADAAGNGPSVADTHNVTVAVPAAPEWSHQAYLKAPNNSDGDKFASSIAISGSTAIIGSHSEDSTTSTIIQGTDLSSTNDAGSSNGAAYVFTRSGDTWSFQAYLKAPNNSDEDLFGAAVAINGDTAIVGAPGEDSDTTQIILGEDLTDANDNGNRNGAAYVFRRSGTIWDLESYFKAPNSMSLGGFGGAVSISGDTIAIGSPTEGSTTTTVINGTDLSSTNSAGSENGAVYIFKRDAAQWTHQAYLKAPNSSWADRFGWSVDLKSDTVVVGAYFETSTTTSIINGSNLASTNNAGTNNGAVYVFRRTGNTWAHEAYLKAPNNSNQDQFGASVSIDGDTIAVGSSTERSDTNTVIHGTDLSGTNNLGSSNGAVYIYKRTGVNWVHEAYLKSPNNKDQDFFGWSVAVDGDTVLVGANQERSDTTTTINGTDLSSSNNAGESNGAAYIFKRSSGIWSHTAYLKAPNTSTHDYFGHSVDISGNTVVVGAHNEDSNTSSVVNGSDLSVTNDFGDNNGAAYVFTLSEQPSSPGIANSVPASEYGTDGQPAFTVTKDDGSNFDPSDKAFLYLGTDCSGSKRTLVNSTNPGAGFDEVSGVSGSSITLHADNPAGSNAMFLYSAAILYADGTRVCTSSSNRPAQQFARYFYDTTDASDVTLSSPTDGSNTNDTQFTVSGAGLDPAATVTVSVSGGGDGSCTTSTDLGGGTWSCTLDSALTGGASVALTITAQQEEPSGNTSNVSDPVNVTLDTVAPGAPVISSPADSATETVGAFSVSGTAEANAAIAVSVDGETADCSDTANGAGAWSCTLDETLADGTYTVRVTQTDAAGNGPSVADTHSVTVSLPYRWSHQAYLKAPNTSDEDEFGYSVSMSGDTVVVGAYREDSDTTAIIHGGTLSASNDTGNNNGAVYVYKRSANTWTHEAYLKPPNNSDHDYFGRAVSISGDTIAVGAYGEDSNTTAIIHGSNLSATNDSGNSKGAVYVFQRSGSTWTHEAYLKAPNSSSGDTFGRSVGISGDTIAVGAEGEGSSTTSIINGSNLAATNDLGSYNGAVYVYKRNGNTWTHEAYLKAPNTSNSDIFGRSVSVSGDTIAVVALEEESNTTAVINGDNLSATNDAGIFSGAVYVYHRTGATWVHQAYLKAPNHADYIVYGASVSVSGDTVAVGASGESSNTTAIIHGSDLSGSNASGSANGAVYIYKRSGSTWAHEAYLKAPNNSNGDQFGASVSLSGDTVAVGAWYENSSTTEVINSSDLTATNNLASQNGAVYVFQRSGSTWAHQAYLKSPNNSNLDEFGYSLELSGNTVAIGAWKEDSNSSAIIHGSDLSAANDSGDNNGAAYVFTLSDMPMVPNIWTADSAGTDSTPQFVISGADTFVASEIIELYGQLDCGGSALQVDEATIGTTQISGFTGDDVFMTVAAADAQTEGTSYYSAKITNADGYTICSSANSDPSKQFVSYTYDNTPPGDVTITSPLDSTVTNDNQFTVSGSGLEEGATLEVTVSGGGGSSCSTTTDLGGGTWSCTLGSALTGGASVALTVSADQEDEAGNTTDTPDSINIVLDTVDPSAPVISAPANSATLADGSITVSGTAEMNSTVSVTVDGETADCSDTANGAGAWSCTLDEVLADGSYTIRAVQTDAAGNGPSTADAHSVTVSSPYQWSHQAYLKAPKSTNISEFGASGNISGDTIVLTASESSTTTAIIHGSDLSSTNDAGSGNGAAYVFQRSGSTWTHQAYLKAPNSSNGDLFGRASISGDTVVVGAFYEDSTTTSVINGNDLSSTNTSGYRNGSAYVFERNGSTWSHRAYLKAPNNTDEDWFGHSVAVSGDYIIIGAPNEDSSTTVIINNSDLSGSNNSGNNNGAAYVFRKSNDLWEFDAYLKPPLTSSTDRFGSHVSISGDTAVVSTPYEDSTTSTIINGDSLSSTNDSGNSNGAAYVFKRGGSGWTHEAYLKAPNSGNQDLFGFAASISGDTIVVGAVSEDSNSTAVINGSDLSASNDSGNSNGAAYVFFRDGGSWTHQAYLKAPNTDNGDSFGQAVAIGGNLVAVGAENESSNTTSVINGDNLASTNNDGIGNGAVYVFRRSGSNWSLESYLKAPNSGNNDGFGTTVGVSGNTVLVGAHDEQGTTTAIIHGSDLSSANNSGDVIGAAYVFTFSDIPAAPGITYSNPATSPGKIAAPHLSIDFSGESLAASDTIEVYGQIDCGGEELKFHVDVEGSSEFTSYTGSTASTHDIEIHSDHQQAHDSTVFYSVKRTNSDGYTICSSANGDPAKQYVRYRYDGIAPGNVAISAPLDNAVTNNNQFTVSGSGLTSGDTVNVAVTGGGGASCSTSTHLGGGTWSCTLSSALTGGASVALTVTAEQEDEAGNTSPAPHSIDVTLDTVTPGAPTITTPADSSTLSSGDITVTGTAEANADVSVTVDGETADCTTTANGAGAWSCLLDETLADASYTIRATQTDVAGNGPSGADTHGVTVSSTGWSMQAYLKAPNAHEGDLFGHAIAVDGDTVVVGAYLEESTTTAIIHGSDLSSTNVDTQNAGAAYVFVRSGSTWTHEAYLKAPNGGEYDDRFGYAVTIEGDTIAATALNEDSGTTSIIHGSDLSSTNNSETWSGAVYVFTRSVGTWTHQAYIKMSKVSFQEQFGTSISLNSNSLAVGNPGERSDATGIVHGSDLSSVENWNSNDSGAALVYTRTGSTWSQQAYMKAPNNTFGDDLGDAIDIDGDTLIAGAPEEDSDTTAIIHGSDLSSTNNDGGGQGAAYVYKRSGSTWAFEAYLKAPNAGGGYEFGQAVAIQGDTAVVGSLDEASNTTAIIHGSDLSGTNSGSFGTGAVYIFTRSGSTWTHQAYLKAPNSDGNDNFGSSVAIDADKVVVGATGEDSNTTTVINGSDLSSTNDSGGGSGAVYVFSRSGSTWTHEAYLKAPNPSNTDYFGSTVSISGNTIAVGARNEDSDTSAIIHGSDLSSANGDGNNQGAAYIFVYQ